MNPLQMALQIRRELRLAQWGTTQNNIFGSRGVSVFAGAPTEEQIPSAFPFCMVSIDGGTPDPSHPELIEQNYTVYTVAEVAGDPLGEFAIAGGARASLTKSAGAGVAELATEVRRVLQNLTSVDGAKIILSSTRTGTPAALGRGKHIAIDELGLTALCTSAMHYAPVQQLAESGGVWTWQGAHCSDRFDFIQYRMFGISGSTPMSTPDDTGGILAYTGTAATATVAAVSGFTYSVFADYNLRDQGLKTTKAIAGSSAGDEVGAYVVVP